MKKSVFTFFSGKLFLPKKTFSDSDTDFFICHSTGNPGACAIKLFTVVNDTMVLAT
jgi:hypothetical protein